MYSNGIVVLTPEAAQGFRVWAVTSLTEPRPMPLADIPPAVLEAIGVGHNSLCMAVLEPHLTASGGLEVRKDDQLICA